MPTPRRLAPVALLLVATALAGGAERAAAAPPVTGPDDLGTTYPRNSIVVDPLANDTDPDGEELTLCGTGAERYRGVRAEFDGYTYVVRIGPRAEPGAYAFGYDACAGGERAPGTVSVTVATPPEVTLRAVPSRPGYVRVHDPADFAVKVFYGAYRTDEPDGIVKVRAGATRLVRVSRERIEILVYDRTGDTFIGRGRVSGIRLPGPTR